MAESDSRIVSEDFADARRIFDAQHAASRADGIPDAATRRNRLRRLAEIVTRNADAIAGAISDDFGVRSRNETELLELAPALGAIKHARQKVARWMKPERRRVGALFQPARAWVRHEPLGVVGVISPWNYPLQLALAPMTDAIAAGNRVMLKPSELTPAFSELIRRLVAERFDEEEVAVVTGGVEVGRAFSELPFDHLLFTGSTAVGRLVHQAAAKNLTPVTLELGGKSPAILCRDYPLEQAARSIAFGKFINAGQTCIAPDYVLAPRERVEELAHELLHQARRAYPQVADNDQYSSIITPRHHERLTKAIEEARAAGARVLSHEDEGARERGKIGPTIILDAPAGTLFLTEEIFGPVLPIVPYDSLEDAAGFVAARERPLALYCFSKDQRQHDRVLDLVLSGGATLNGTILHVGQDNLPFGGVGPSGIGAYHGIEGFRRFSHVRGVHKIGFINTMERLGPPWGRMADRLGQRLVKRR